MRRSICATRTEVEYLDSPDGTQEEISAVPETPPTPRFASCPGNGRMSLIDILAWRLCSGKPFYLVPVGCWLIMLNLIGYASVHPCWYTDLRWRLSVESLKYQG